MADTSPATLEVSSAVTKDDHGAQIVIVAILGLIASLTVLANRLLLRWPWKERFGVDDFVCVAATLLATAQTGTLLSAVAWGLGERSRLLTPRELDVVGKLVYTSSILFVLALCLSKLAVGFLFNRLSSRAAVKAIIHAIVIYGVAGILVVAVDRNMAEPWKIGSTSRDSFLARWSTVEALGLVLDVILIVYPAVLVRGLKMSRSTKIAVFLGFASRFPVLIFAGLRIAYIANMKFDDLSFSSVVTIILGLAEMHCNVVAATIPCLRIFLKGWNTSFMNTTLKEMDPEAYTRHSSVASPRSWRTLRKSKASSSSQSKRRQSSYGGVWDGATSRIESNISSEHITSNLQVSAGSRSITVQRSIDVDIK
ncbi:hypothetical protein CKM354_001182700 [Cercospora kikuchii]|uniref:Rhodopsin domain-containing protein n=1 Tax=Cercospora kikuchii TaxID=84275 RepID=A0A9P3FLD0_9PEZI|nr:uncharacterized protein CKM354_001182700 [Cercospora kikuchii]GIZ48780.1 hypothetical protein CKM354_001182700 [Cercospora kikuchii]